MVESPPTGDLGVKKQAAVPNPDDGFTSTPPPPPTGGYGGQSQQLEMVVGGPSAYICAFLCVTLREIFCSFFDHLKQHFFISCSLRDLSVISVNSVVKWMVVHPMTEIHKISLCHLATP